MNERFMARALQLAAFGGSRVSPNPFVGAVIVSEGRIIGEGYHRVYGGPHAEPNAINSVAPDDRELLSRSTMYVTLEPCSHHGKTPPCADLIVRTGIPEVVIATRDPFLTRVGSGIDILQKAGVKVQLGMMEKEARFINRRFFTAHTLLRPFILLKWAQTADGFIAGDNGKPIKISNPVSSVMMHRERSFYDAIMVGVDTVIADNPRLDCRLWPARQPGRRPVTVGFDSPRLPADSRFVDSGPLLKEPGESLQDFMHRLYSHHGITSIMVEGGLKTLRSFIREDLFDEIRIETASGLSSGSGIPAPTPGESSAFHALRRVPPRSVGGNIIDRFVKNY